MPYAMMIKKQDNSEGSYINLTTNAMEISTKWAAQVARANNKWVYIGREWSRPTQVVWKQFHQCSTTEKKRECERKRGRKKHLPRIHIYTRVVRKSVLFFLVCTALTCKWKAESEWMLFSFQKKKKNAIAFLFSFLFILENYVRWLIIKPTGSQTESEHIND